MQADINPASGSRSFDKSEFPLSSVPWLWENAPQWPNPTNREIDAMINIIRFT